LFLYWQERKLENTISQDSGAFIRDGMKVAQKIGCCPEVDYPYDITKFRDTPSVQAEQDASTYKVTEYHRISNYNDMLTGLAIGQWLVVTILQSIRELA